MRGLCRPGAADNITMLFEFTRKSFADSFPLPYVEQDIAMFLLVRIMKSQRGDENQNTSRAGNLIDFEFARTTTRTGTHHGGDRAQITRAVPEHETKSET